MKRLITLAAAVVCLPLVAAESAVVVTEIRRASAAEYYWMAGPEQDEALDDGFSISPGVWTYDAFVESHTPRAEGEISTTHTSDVSGTGLSAALRSSGEMSFDEVDDWSASAEGEFTVHFTVDIDTVFEVDGTVAVTSGTQGWAGYAIDRFVQGGFDNVVSFEAGDQTEFGSFPIDEAGMLIPGDYVLYVYSYFQESGDALADIVVALEAMTVPVVESSWSAIKNRFRP